jgi:hypothetical protein
MSGIAHRYRRAVRFQRKFGGLSGSLSWSGSSGLSGLSRLFGLSGSSSYTNQIDQMNQTDQKGRRAHTDARRPCPQEERLT